jgi:hypothetical protein
LNAKALHKIIGGLCAKIRDPAKVPGHPRGLHASLEFREFEFRKIGLREIGNGSHRNACQYLDACAFKMVSTGRRAAPL